MKSIALIALLVIASLSSLKAQEFGLSFSYFIPKNGDFSTPISPFSLRGMGFNINRFLALESGFTLYRMSGLNLKDLPFENKKSLVGPNFTVFIPAELVIQLKASNVQLDLKGGGFFFYGFANKLNEGNIDRALAQHENWDIASSKLNFDNHPGFGYHAGTELTVYITNQIGISLEINYLIGQANFPLTGTYSGGNDLNNGTSTYETLQADDLFVNSKLDLTGLEFSVGVIFDSGGGGAPSRKRRR